MLQTMISSNTPAAPKVATAFGWVLLVVATVLCGCGKAGGDRASGNPTGRATETAAYWTRFERGASFGSGIEALNSPVYAGPVPSKHLYAALADIADAEHMRGRTVLSLPTTGVASELVSYTDAFGKSRLALAELIRAYVELAKELEDVGGKAALDGARLKRLLDQGPNNIGGVILSGMTNAVSDSARETASLRESARQLEARAAGVLAEIERLRGEEPKLLAQLGSRFQQNFAPRTPPHAAVENSPGREFFLEESQIVVTLMGQSVGGLVTGWTFEDPREIKSFKILAATNHSPVLGAYEVRAHVQGLRTGQERDFHLELTYGRLYTRWVLLELKELR